MEKFVSNVELKQSDVLRFGKYLVTYEIKYSSKRTTATSTKASTKIVDAAAEDLDEARLWELINPNGVDIVEKKIISITPLDQTREVTYKGSVDDYETDSVSVNNTVNTKVTNTVDAKVNNTVNVNVV